MLSTPFDDSKLYLKIHDDFVDAVKEALGIALNPDTTKLLGALFRSNLRNKLKRDIKMKKGNYNDENNKAKKAKK